jgi:hypothetical protein
VKREALELDQYHGCSVTNDSPSSERSQALLHSP